jgi:hypothetical protein
MSLEHSPAKGGSSIRVPLARAAYTLSEFCEAHRISRSQLYKYWQKGQGPRFFWVGTKRCISIEAAADWRREREAEAV